MSVIKKTYNNLFFNHLNTIQKYSRLEGTYKNKLNLSTIF
ncbi:hypothetical protein SAMN05421594_0714 [Chryseobacterium oleae]|uniref:Uncharacterized protein n=1 Tax=Chryseobacterium oleae TaxID=491207 RepID=A0A1I4VYA6_CHROL|nr:hypothetical protein SAMN05421594_0714 [Chryseobacterium oleae]